MTLSTVKDRIYKETREELKKNLAECTEGEQRIFKLMYSHGNLKLPINEVVDKMEEEKLDWTSQQVQRTLDQKGGKTDG